ncbi:MAG: catechol 2,3-dioxygenase-like lactoylglutathione lyase family enzyme [Myxococcota bacterium]
MTFGAPRYFVLFVASVDRSIEFYTRVLGVRVKLRSGAFAQLDTGQTRFCLYERTAMAKTLGQDLVPPRPDGPGFSIGFQVDDVDVAYAEVLARGAKSAGPPTDRFWGQRTAYFKDVDGHLIELASQRRDPTVALLRSIDAALKTSGRELRAVALEPATEAEIQTLERWVDAKLPPSYVAALKHRHLTGLELSVISPMHDQPVSVALFGHAYEPEVAQRPGLLPFASCGDLGLVCFDTQRRWDNGEHPVVLWDRKHPGTKVDLWPDLFAMVASARGTGSRD